MSSTYLYHGTTKENLEYIAERGLVPRQRGVFVFNNPTDAILWASNIGRFVIPEFHWAIKKSGDYGPVILRFDPKETGLVFRVDRALGNGESLVTRGRIPPELIEVNARGSWIPLKRVLPQKP